ncbi:UNVERIFIED_CONTAM: Hyoscyamine 6-dioxygenase [Sesamum calycinum]|uniref:Hyoscyamine 6-dioxygenase n=1 Tax=Sesamum calycinum TaxID=2727403 RepID=A0AAW2SFM5_9LAMI
MGFPESRMDDTMNVLKEFFGMSAEYKAGFYSMDIRRKCRIYSSSLNYDNEEVHYWDNFTHYCFPLKDHLLELWPEKPIKYREVVSAYSVEVRKLMLRILDLIREGLGLKLGFFEGELTQNQLLSVNYHIPCPNPSLTLGMPQHCDPNLISMLHQCSVPGLQVLHRGQWMTVDPMPNAFVLNLGLQFKVISNGKFASPIHRVITHREEGRTTIATFLIPADDTFIQPPNKNHAGDDAPLYRCFTYKEFYSTFNKNVSDPDFALEYFKNTTK